MGVLGLWQVLESVGHPIKLDGLEGKHLGVDANVWLYKFIRGFREKDNAQSIDSHKLGLFNRISKLLFYKIKPVFVFDGPAPVLKRRTLERRQNLRNKELIKAQDAAMKLIAGQLKEQYPDANLDEIKIQLPNLRSNNLLAAEKLTDEDRELFYLPPVVVEDADRSSASDEDSDIQIDQKKKSPIKEEGLVYHIDSDDDDDLLKPKVDIESQDFKSLPAEVRYEILTEIRENNRRIRRAQALPEDPNNFSKFQLERLKAKRAVQEKIEISEKDICSMYTGETGNGQTVRSYRMQSDETSTMLYFKNNKSTKEPTAQPDQKPVNWTIPTPGTSQSKPETISPFKTDEVKESLKPRHPMMKPLFDLPSSKAPSERLIRINKAMSGKTPSNNLKAQDIEPLLSPNFSDSSDSDTEIMTSQESTKQPDASSAIVGKASSSHLNSQDIESLQSTSISDSSDSDTQIMTSQEFAKQPETMLDDTILIESSIESSPSSSPEPTVLIESSDASSSSNSPEPTIFIETSDCDTPKSAKDSPPKSTKDTPPKSTKDSPPKSTEDTPPKSTEDTPLKSSASEETRTQSQPISTSFIGDDEHRSFSQPIEKIIDEKVLEKKTSDTEPSNLPKKSTRNERQVTFNSQNMAELNNIQANSNRVSKKVTTKIVEEAKELLRLFGVPYIDAAGEAEAQCALLEELGLTEGTITDDSDVWLFGAKNVYRHFFSDDKYVMQYKLPEIEFHLRLSRENLVCFAMLVGSDYTDGIMNVGPVTALEILSEFPGEDMEPLIKFKNWRLKYHKQKERKPGSKKRESFLKYRLPDEFPSRTVFEGYMRPLADTSTEKFSWGTPELDELREYARRNFGWDTRKIDEKLLPVMKKINERKTQPTIDSYFFKTAANQNPDLFRSKRVNQALNKIATKRNKVDNI